MVKINNQITWIDNDLKIQKSIDRLKMFEPEEGYYLAFSGGKDSIVIKQLAIEAGVEFDSHYNLTTVDPPELIQYIKKNHSDVEIHLPKETMWQLISKKTMPPTRFMRYCCNVLKEGGGEDRFVVTGVRWAESPKRKTTRGSVEVVTKQIKNKLILNADNDEDRRMIESCVIKGKRVLNPIIDWSDEEVWSYIKSRKIDYCSLYDEGFERLGCIGCPLSGEKNMKMQFERWPMYRRSYIRSFDKMLINRVREGKKTEWEDGSDVMNWWTSDFRKEKQVDGQIDIYNELDKLREENT